MSKKIIGVTVGSQLPKPNLMQTDPKKGDFVKGKDEFLKDPRFKDVLVVTSEVTRDGVFLTGVASHNATEIKAAADAGKAVFLCVESEVYSLTGYAEGLDFIPDGSPAFESRHTYSSGETLNKSVIYVNWHTLYITQDNEIKQRNSMWMSPVLGQGSGTASPPGDSGDDIEATVNSAVNSAIEELKASGELKGDKGDPFTYSDFTPEQLAALKGDKGDPGTTNYEELDNRPVIPSSVTAVEHQYAVANSKEQISDVVTWNVHTSAQTKLSKRVRACIFANGYYVACGTNAELGYSTDGETWTVVAPFISTSLTLTNITYGKGKFVVLDQNGNLFAAEGTPDTWTKICDESYWPSGVGSLIYANNQFVAAGDYFAAFSEDCISWTIVEAPSTYNQIAFGNGRYVAVGGGGAVSVSYDGKTWTDCSNPDVTGDLRAVTYAQGRWFIGGINGTIMYTDDFVNWGIATSNSEGVRYVRAIVYMENKFYAACYNSSPARGEIWVSDDGITWTVQHQQSSMLWCMSAKDGRLITAGDSGCVCILDLGIEWLRKQPELASGQHLWERIVFILSDGGETVSDGICIKSAPNTENWVFTLEDGSTVTKAVNVG